MTARRARDGRPAGRGSCDGSPSATAPTNGRYAPACTESNRSAARIGRVVTTRTEDLESLLARIPDPAIRTLFTPEFILCAEHFDRFTTDWVLRLVHELGLAEPLADGASAGRV